MRLGNFRTAWTTLLSLSVFASLKTAEEFTVLLGSCRAGIFFRNHNRISSWFSVPSKIRAHVPVCPTSSLWVSHIHSIFRERIKASLAVVSKTLTKCDAQVPYNSFWLLLGLVLLRYGLLQVKFGHKKMWHPRIFRAGAVSQICDWITQCHSVIAPTKSLIRLGNFRTAWTALLWFSVFAPLKNAEEYTVLFGSCRARTYSRNHNILNRPVRISSWFFVPRKIRVHMPVCTTSSFWASHIHFIFRERMKVPPAVMSRTLAKCDAEVPYNSF